MKDKNKTKEHLIKKLPKLRKQIAASGIAGQKHKQTGRKTVLLDKEAHTEAILAAIGDGISIQNTNFKILYQNQIHKNLVGDHIGEYCYAAYRQTNKICNECPVALSFKSGKIHTVERRVAAEKRTIYLEVTASPLKDSAGKLIAGIEVVRDITERKQAEKSLRESKEFIENIIESMNDGFSVLDANGIRIMANNAFYKMMGFSKDELIGSGPPYPFWPPECIKEIQEEFNKMKRGEAQDFELTFMRKNGERFPVLISSSTIKNEHGKIISHLIIIKDITERRQALNALKESEEKFREVAEQSPNMIFINKKGRIAYANKKCEEVMGYRREEFYSQGFDFFTLIAPEYINLVRENFSRHMKGKEIVPYEYALITKEGKKIEAIITTKLIKYEGEKSILGIVTDITDRKKKESEFLRTEKLESLGILAGGIAHDFNNILTAIIGNIGLAKMYAKPGLEVYDILTEVEKASLRAKNLTTQLLTFSKGGMPAKKTASLSKLMQDSAAFALSGSNVKCEFSIQNDIYPVEVDENQIGQTLQNLIINAQQAMPSGGIIRIGAKNIVIGSEDTLALKKGNYIKISISDKGIGIPEEYLQKIFDPYFTTKQGGSGLGLATAFSIIKKHDGHITVESKLGYGTTFYIFLPASGKNIAEIIETKMALPAEKGKGRILVMDDEEIVRSVSGRMLNQCGYDAEFAEDGLIAIEMYKKAKESGNSFDAVIIDLVIPAGMGGEDTIKKLLEIDPDVKAIVSSGYSEDPVIANYQKYGFKDVLAKPYEITGLHKVLHKVLSRK